MSYKFPPMELLGEKRIYDNISVEELEKKAVIVKQVFYLWGIGVKNVAYRVTPLTICFEVTPETGASVKNVKKLKLDLEVNLAGSVEIINNTRNSTITVLAIRNDAGIIGIRDLIDSNEFQNNKSPLSVVVGVDYDGSVLVADIEELPHLLIAGTTGSGKTVFLDDLLLSIIYHASPEEVSLIMIDPKQVDLAAYEGIPHLLSNVKKYDEDTFSALSWVEEEMIRRYTIFEKHNCKNLSAFYEKSNKKIPNIVVVIDEYSELMLDYKSDTEDIIARIAHLGRGAGIHLVIATQRPTSDVITGTIKNNLTARASFTVVDAKESKAIIERAGAQRLKGNGDMMFSFSASSLSTHAQAPYVDLDTVKSVVEWVKVNNNYENAYMGINADHKYNYCFVDEG